MNPNLTSSPRPFSPVRVFLAWGAVAALALLSAGCRSPMPSAPSAPPAAALDEASFEVVALTNSIAPQWLNPPTNFFQLGPGDVIEIENLGQPQEPIVQVLVGPDGKIYYSMLPGLSVWGLALGDTKDLLERELNRFTRVKPELAVSLRAVGSKRIWILGGVQSPGVYSMAAPLTILDAVALAGGIRHIPGSSSGMPDLANSFVMRQGEMLPLDLHRLISQGDLSQNIYLQPDDFVYLRSALSRDVFVLGAVAAPNVVNYHDRLSLLAALTTVGGTVQYANVGQVAIVRGSLSLPRVAVVDYQAILKGRAPDVLLQPGDIVYVPFVAYRRLGLLAERMLRTFVRTVAANEGNRASVPDAEAIGVTAAPAIPTGGGR